MAKYSKRAVLNRRETERLFVDFCRYLSELRTATEVAQALGDLLTKQEVLMVSKRLRIGIFLMEGKTYDEIGHRLRTSSGTVARVNLWLREAGEGYRLLYTRGRKYRTKPVPPTAWEQEWRRIRRRYPLYYWPRLLLEEVVRQANARQRAKIASVLRALERRGRLTNSLSTLRTLVTEQEVNKNYHTS